MIADNPLIYERGCLHNRASQSKSRKLLLPGRRVTCWSHDSREADEIPLGYIRTSKLRNRRIQNDPRRAGGLLSWFWSGYGLQSCLLDVVQTDSCRSQAFDLSWNLLMFCMPRNLCCSDPSDEVQTLGLTQKLLAENRIEYLHKITSNSKQSSANHSRQRKTTETRAEIDVSIILHRYCICRCCLPDAASQIRERGLRRAAVPTGGELIERLMLAVKTNVYTSAVHKRQLLCLAYVRQAEQRRR